MKKDPRAMKRTGAVDDYRARAFVGTSGWDYPSWKPGFYSQSIPRKKFLEYYATQLNSVEVNYTFRQLPTESMVRGWLDATGAGFRFSFKAPQRITHLLRLKDCSESVASLSRALAPVVAAERMGAVLFQLPPNFKADLLRLESFLADTNAYGWRKTLEFRNGTWFCEEVYALLRQYGVALCIAGSDELETPAVATAPFTYFRLRKSGYSARQLGTIKKTLRQRSSEGEVFAYFKHEEQPTGAIWAVESLRKLRII